jgi:two-component system sensor histidine kinase DesK
VPEPTIQACDYGKHPGLRPGREPMFAPGLRPATPAGRARKALGILFSMAWLIWPLIELTTSGAPAWRMVVVLAAIGVWVAIYLVWVLGRVQEPSDRENLVFLSVLLLGAVTLTVFDRGSWSVLFVYCSSAGGISLGNDRWAARWVIFCTLICAAVLFGALGDPDGIGISLTATTLAIGFLLFSFGRLIRANAALRMAQEEIAVRRVDEERLRFARDLHDLLGHDLSVISLKAQLARRLMGRDPSAAERELTDVQEVARTALTQVREAVAGYRQPALASELAGARSALDAAGIACTVEHADVSLPPSREAVLAWGVREATTNVIRHSDARHCEIRIAVAGEEATLAVTDDGQVDGVDGDGDGTGLRGLAERAAAAGGRMDAGPRPEGGYELQLRVPLSALA